MTRAQLGAALILWAAASYRTLRAIRNPRWWRAWLSVSLAALALAATAHPFRGRLDLALGIPNLTNLAGRSLLCLAVVGAQFYLGGVKGPDAAGPGRTRIVAVGAAAVCVSCASWAMAPIHDVELLDLGIAPRHAATLVYAVTVYVYLAWFLLDLWNYARRTYRAARSQDPPAAAVIALIAASIVAGLLTLSAWTADASVSQVLGVRSSVLDSVAAVLFPVAMTLFALGMFSLPVAAIVSHQLAARRLSQQLEPLWEAVLSTHPEVALSSGRYQRIPGLGLRWKAQRRLIEVCDGLEAHKVASVGSLDELASALRAPTSHAAHDLSAKDVLVQLDGTPWPQPLVDLSTAMSRQRQARNTGLPVEQ